MAITLQCPRCSHEQSIDDDRANSEVPCKICHHPITPSAAPPKPKTTAVQTKAAPKAAPKKSKPAPSDGLQAGPPPVKGSKPPAVGGTKPSKRKPKEDDEEDDDDEDGAGKKRPGSRRKPAAGQSSSMTYAMLVGGGLLLLALLCGGGGLGAYALLGSGGNNAGPIAEGPPMPDPNDPNPPPNPIPNPVIDPFPVPFPNPPMPRPRPNPKPAPIPLDPNNPADVDRVLAALRGPAQERGQAIHWLNAANTNHPRRAEIAKQLDGMVEESIPQLPGSDSFFNVYHKWATKDSGPYLIKMAENTRFTPWDNRHRQEAMRLLGRFKIADGAPAIAKRLADHFDRGVAVEALIELGPKGESEVLQMVNHPDHGTRDGVRRILLAYNTKNEKIVGQCIADFDSPDNNRRSAALQWLLKNPVEPARKTELSKALNKWMVADNCLHNRDLVTALETWGTSENTTRITELMEKGGTFGNREAIRLLAKIHDPKSVKALARQLAASPFVAGDARNALKDFGLPAELAVIEVLTTTNDARGRTECVRCLGEIGTRAISIPALQAMSVRLQQDRLFIIQVQSAANMINKRGK